MSSAKWLVIGLAVATWPVAVGAQATSSTGFSKKGPVGASVQNGGASTMNFTLVGGVATGEGGIDLGVAVGATLEWKIGNAPVGVRLDPYFARHGGSCEPASCSLTILGAGGAAVYRFPQAQRSMSLQGTGTGAPSWYAFAGLGIYRSDFNFDYEGDISLSGSGNSTDLGLQLGGGANVGANLVLEARYMDVDGFNPLLLLVGWKFK